MTWPAVIHAVHILLAGLWVGGLVFTASVVSPAFRRMEWTPAERIAVRSEVGRQYSRVARPNLALLFLVALADWLPAGLGAVAGPSWASSFSWFACRSCTPIFTCRAWRKRHARGSHLSVRGCSAFRSESRC